jgi:hypothetical protein
MKRLAITLEDYDDSKVVHASMVTPQEEATASLVLTRAGVQFVIDEVQGPLFDYLLEYGRSHVDLHLRTKAEIACWIETETFEATVGGFLESGGRTLRLDLDGKDEFLKISRQEI